MRRKGVSPWLIAERNRVRTKAPEGVAHRIASGETPLEAWRLETGFSIIKLARLTGLDGWYLIQLERGDRAPRADDLARIAIALRVTVDLLRNQGDQ